MIEIPESATLAGQLNENIKEKTILNVYAGVSPHKFAFYHGEPEGYQQLLSGKIVSAVTAIGGQIEIEAEGVILLLGEGLNIRYTHNGETLPKKYQMQIEFDDFTSLIFTVQMYGLMFAFKKGELDNFYYSVSKEKPNPLTDEFNEVYFDNLLSAVVKNMSAKAFLATEQRIPGLGNGVLQDILFEAGINPKKKMVELSSEQTDTIYRAVKHKLWEMTVSGGRDTENDLYGIKGGYKTILSAKTVKEPCKVCGSVLVRQAYLGGNVYFCPVCQQL